MILNIHGNRCQTLLRALRNGIEQMDSLVDAHTERPYMKPPSLFGHGHWAKREKERYVKLYNDLRSQIFNNQSDVEKE